MQYRVQHDITNAAILPAHLNEITTENAHTRQSRKLWLVAMFQTRGRYLDAIYLETAHSPTAEDRRIATALAQTTGRRLERTA
jgi:hypothetical protein